MSTEQGYNGWTNYETWAVGMYLDGNYTGEGTYRDVLQIVRDVVRLQVDDDESISLAAVHARPIAVANALKDYVEESIGDDLPNGLATDLLRAALSEVNWLELAEAKLAEVTED